MKSIAELREEIRAARRAVGPDVRQQHSSSVCQHISELVSYQSANRIAAYLAFDGEADPMELMISAVEQGKTGLPSDGCWKIKTTGLRTLDTVNTDEKKPV